MPLTPFIPNLNSAHHTYCVDCGSGSTAGEQRNIQPVWSSTYNVLTTPNRPAGHSYQCVNAQMNGWCSSWSKVLWSADEALLGGDHTFSGWLTPYFQKPSKNSLLPFGFLTPYEKLHFIGFDFILKKTLPFIVDLFLLIYVQRFAALCCGKSWKHKCNYCIGCFQRSHDTHLESCVAARSRFGCWGSHQENQDSVSPLMKKSSPHWLDTGLGWEIDVRITNWSWSFFIHLSKDPPFKIIKWKTRLGLSGECVCVCACATVCVGALWISSKLITVTAKKKKKSKSYFLNKWLKSVQLLRISIIEIKIF